MPKQFRFTGSLMAELANDFTDELNNRTEAWKKATEIANNINILLGQTEHHDDTYQKFCRKYGEEIADALINVPGENRAFIFSKGGYPYIVIGTNSIPGKSSLGKEDIEIVERYFKIVSLTQLHQLQEESHKQ